MKMGQKRDQDYEKREKLDFKSHTMKSNKSPTCYSIIFGKADD